MSSIHYLAYRHATVGAAIDAAAKIVHEWRESERITGDSGVAERVNGWTAVSLVERIAWGLLEQQGFDIDGLCEALGSCSPGEEADVLGSWPEPDHA